MFTVFMLSASLTVCSQHASINGTQTMEGALDAGGVTIDDLYDFFTNGTTGKGKAKNTTTNQKSKTNKKKNSNADALNNLVDRFLGF